MEAPATPERKLRRLASSALASLAGWAAVLLPQVAWAVLSHGKRSAAVADAEGLACVALAFVLAAWIVVVAPLVWFVPARSRMWRWPAAVPLGTLAGTAFLSLAYIGERRPCLEIARQAWPLIVLAALVGGVTGGLGSWMLRRRTGGKQA